MNLEIFTGEKVRKVAIGSATLIALAVVAYFVVSLRTQLDIRLPSTSQFSTATAFYPSGLEALLISDPTATQASAALSLGVGSGLETVPGLAHFLEHLLFISSSQFPQQDHFSVFISENGGSTNAYTELEETNFYFDVKSTALQRALEMFASLITSPLFPADRLSDEVKAVHSEFLNDQISEEWRRLRLLQLQANPKHSFSHFSAGNEETLHRTELRDLVQEFHRKWYRGSAMKLVVLSSHPLPQLRSWVAQSFSTLPRGSVLKPSPPKPFAELNKLIIAPRQVAGETLTLYVPLPSQRELRGSLPVSFLTYLLGLETESSLAAELRARDLAYSLSAGFSADYSDFAVLEVHMELTKRGLRHWQDCLQLYRDYVSALADLDREELKEAWDFFVDAETLKFDYLFEWEGGRSASQVARNMQSFPRTQYLSGLQLPDQFDFPLLQSYLKGQLQEGLLALLMSTRFSPGSKVDGRELSLNEHEHYFGIDYETAELPTAGIATQWRLNLPADLEVSVPKMALCPDCSVDPVLIEGVWFLVTPIQFDRALKQPQASVSLLFPVAAYSLEAAIQGELYALQLYTQLSEVLARHLLAGSSLEVSWTS